MELLKLILLFGIYQAFLLVFLVLIKRRRQRSDYFLALVLFVFAITVLMAFGEIYNRQNGYPFPWLINSSSPLLLLHGPVLWLYVQSLTRSQFQVRWTFILHFIPFIFAVVLLQLFTGQLPVNERILMLETESFAQHYSFPLLVVMIAVFTQSYFFWGLTLVKRYRIKVENYFSDISGRELKWLRVYLISCTIFYAGASILYIADYIVDFLSYEYLQALGYSYATLLIFVLGFFGYRQGNIFSTSANDFLRTEINSSTPQIPVYSDNSNLFVEKLFNFMETEKPFTNPELTLSGLAQMLHVTPTYLSTCLNGELGKNFYDFVNSYRVNEFKRLCKTGSFKEITIIGLAWDSGFNSKATFNRVFKRMEGTTPGEFIRWLQQKEVFS